MSLLFDFLKMHNHIDYSGFQGSGIKHLDKNYIKNMSFYIPSINEQKKIVSTLESVDLVIKNSEIKIDKLKDLKKSILNKLMTKGISNTKFKDSTMGKIPVDWNIKKLTDCLEKIVDCEHKTAPKVSYSNYWAVPTNAVKDGKMVLSELYNISEDSFTTWTNREIPRRGDVMFTREAPSGETCIINEDRKVCLGQRMVLLRPKKEVTDGNFLNYFFNTDKGKKSIFRLSLGTTVSRINIEDIKKLKVLIPSISEQNEITNILLSHDDNLDKEIQKLTKLKFFKKSLLKNLISGKKKFSTI